MVHIHIYGIHMLHMYMHTCTYLHTYTKKILTLQTFFNIYFRFAIAQWFHLMTSKPKAQLAPLPWTEILGYWVLSFGSHLYSFYQLHRFSKGKVDGQISVCWSHEVRRKCKKNMKLLLPVLYLRTWSRITERIPAGKRPS